MKEKDVKLTRKNGGIYFIQNGVEYNLYKMPKVGADELFYIEGNLNLSNMGLTRLPDLSDCQVNGSFDCSHNPLTSLRGCPMYVCGDFTCTHTNITTLKGISSIEGFHGVNIDLSHNKLKNLQDMAYNDDTLDAFVDVSYNELTSLRGIGHASNIINFLNCSHNKLKSLSDIDDECRFATIDCSYNNLSRMNFDEGLYDTIKWCKEDGAYVYDGPNDPMNEFGLGFMKIDNFVGNPCFEKYARWLLKTRGFGDYMLYHVPEEVLSVLFESEELRNRLGLFIEAEELKTANRELFDNKKTFARGQTVVKSLGTTKATQRKIQPRKDDKEH